MDVKQQVFMRLKPKAKAFGFNKKELQGVAAKIADNLTFEEDALEEDVNALIDEQNRELQYKRFAALEGVTKDKEGKAKLTNKVSIVVLVRFLMFFP